MGHSPKKTSASFIAKVIPKDSDLQSVISEEEEGIMSTGGAIDEDGINNSIVYQSSIRSVKRNLASNVGQGKIAAVQIVDTLSPTGSQDSSSESNVNKKLEEAPSQMED